MNIEIIVKVKMPIVCQNVHLQIEEFQYDELSFIKKYSVNIHDDYQKIENDINRVMGYEEKNSSFFDSIEVLKNRMSDDDLLKSIDDYLNKIEETGFSCLD